MNASFLLSHTVHVSYQNWQPRRLRVRFLGQNLLRRFITLSLDFADEIIDYWNLDHLTEPWVMGHPLCWLKVGKRQHSNVVQFSCLSTTVWQSCAILSPVPDGWNWLEWNPVQGQGVCTNPCRWAPSSRLTCFGGQVRFDPISGPGLKPVLLKLYINQPNQMTSS